MGANSQAAPRQGGAAVMPVTVVRLKSHMIDTRGDRTDVASFPCFMIRSWRVLDPFDRITVMEQ
jgi:hypothetical protein